VQLGVTDRCVTPPERPALTRCGLSTKIGQAIAAEAPNQPQRQPLLGALTTLPQSGVALAKTRREIAQRHLVKPSRPDHLGLESRDDTGSDGRRENEVGMVRFRQGRQATRGPVQCPLVLRAHQCAVARAPTAVVRAPAQPGGKARARQFQVGDCLQQPGNDLAVDVASVQGSAGTPRDPRRPSPKAGQKDASESDRPLLAVRASPAHQLADDGVSHLVGCRWLAEDAADFLEREEPRRECMADGGPIDGWGVGGTKEADKGGLHGVQCGARRDGRHAWGPPLNVDRQRATVPSQITHRRRAHRGRVSRVSAV
jgi:hypothetical protein